jgi:TolB protein
MTVPALLTRMRSFVTPLSVVCSGVIAVAAANPHGSRIAFEGDGFSAWGLSVMQADGSGAASLNAPPGSADVAWSPDGKRVAFEADPSGGGNLEIFVMNADGTAMIQLADSPGRDYWPATSGS